MESPAIYFDARTTAATTTVSRNPNGSLNSHGHRLKPVSLSGSHHPGHYPEQKHEQETARHARFERAVLPHLDAAHNLARWLTRNEADADDVMQEAFLRAIRFFGGFYGEDGRPWLLKIVRNTYYTWLQRNRSPELSTAFDEEIHSIATTGSNPEELLLRSTEKRLLRKALEELPVDFREVVILREIKGLSYKQIADNANLPMGTVMSRLSRARKRLQVYLNRDHEHQLVREYSRG